MPLYPASQSRPRIMAADCDASDSVFDCVHVAAAAVAGRAQVRKCDPKTNGFTHPPVGVIFEKPTATTAIVITLGEMDVGVALTPGRSVWVGANAQPTSSVPSPDPGGKIATILIGTATDAGRLFVRPESRPIIRSDA